MTNKNRYALYCSQLRIFLGKLLLHLYELLNKIEHILGLANDVSLIFPFKDFCSMGSNPLPVGLLWFHACCKFVSSFSV